jgi:hypothetical protein
MELCMTWYGKAFLEASIGSVIRRVCAEKVAIEVDPFRSGKSTKDVERNVDQLIYWCQEFWTQIYSVRAECPQCVLFVCSKFLSEEFTISTGSCVDSSKLFAPLSKNDIGWRIHLKTSIESCLGKACLRSVS